MKLTKQIIIPLYIYHKKIGNEFRGLIQYSNKLSSIYKGWKLYATIYVFSPLLIPQGTKLFSLKINKKSPHDLEKYGIVRDMYNINLKDSSLINFSTYNLKVLNTKPFYFHTKENHVFPSFDINPPDNSGWKLSGVNPIYVMTSNKVTFYCENGVCVPLSIVKDEFINNMLDNNYKTIEDCLNTCNTRAKGILENIKSIGGENEEQKRLKKIKKYSIIPDFRNTANILLFIVVPILIIIRIIILFKFNPKSKK